MNISFKNRNNILPKRLVMVAFLYSVMIFGQQSTSTDSISGIAVDSLYREDQFYVGITFNLLLQTPVSQSGFSGGLYLGYTRDMPINKRRNKAIGLGLGYSVNTYGQNLFIGEEANNEQSIFIDLEDEDVDYTTNRFSTHLIEAPLEYRWRTSVPETHKFWRIYTGIRFGYVYRFKSSFEEEGNKVQQTKIIELNRWRVGATVAFGWNTFNFYIYYSLNPLFNKDALLGEEEIGMTTAKFGLMFYIL